MPVYTPKVYKGQRSKPRTFTAAVLQLSWQHGAPACASVWVGKIRANTKTNTGSIVVE